MAPHSLPPAHSGCVNRQLRPRILCHVKIIISEDTQAAVNRQLRPRILCHVKIIISEDTGRWLLWGAIQNDVTVCSWTCSCVQQFQAVGTFLKHITGNRQKRFRSFKANSIIEKAIGKNPLFYNFVRLTDHSQVITVK